MDGFNTRHGRVIAIEILHQKVSAQRFDHHFCRRTDILIVQRIKSCAKSIYSVRTEDSIPMLESVINISVDEDSWLWVLRENARYKLMGILSRQCKDFKRLAEMVDLLKPNRDKFDDRLDALQNNKI